MHRTTRHALAVVALITVAILAGCGGPRSQASYPEVTLTNGGLKRGPRSVPNIIENFERMMPRIIYLYSEALGPDSSLRGIMTIRMDVDANGKPGYVGVHQTTINNETLENLILAAIVETEFDGWTEGRARTEVIYPIELRPDMAKNAPKSRARRQFEKSQQLKGTGDTEDSTDEENEWAE